MSKLAYEKPDLIVLNNNDNDNQIMPTGIPFLAFILVAGILVFAVQYAAAIDGIHVAGNLHTYVTHYST